MEETVMGLLGLVTGTLSYGIANAIPIAIGALLGPTIVKAGLGVVSDMLGRGRVLSMMLLQPLLERSNTIFGKGSR